MNRMRDKMQPSVGKWMDGSNVYRHRREQTKSVGYSFRESFMHSPIPYHNTLFSDPEPSSSKEYIYIYMCDPSLSSTSSSPPLTKLILHTMTTSPPLQRTAPTSIPSIRMFLLRILASLLFHLPIVLSIPQHSLGTPSHHRRYNRSLEVIAPLPPPPPPPPTTIIEPVPFPLPPTTSFPLPPPTTTTSDPWRDMCLPGQECDCTRIEDKNGEE